MDKFQNKYRIPSARLQNWDYGANGSYFITICTQDRQHYFGEIINKEMQLNVLGEMAEKHWMEIPIHFSFIELGNFVIMPNHMHGILIIDKNANSPNLVGDTMNIADVVLDRVETRLIASLPQTTDPPPPNHSTHPTNPTDSSKSTNSSSNEINGGFSGIKNPMFHENISRVIRWYKGRCSFEMHKINANFEWQSRFHDHIIRNELSFKNIQSYISNNPSNWGKDKFGKNSKK
jgi:putative transposase